MSSKTPSPFAATVAKHGKKTTPRTELEGSLERVDFQERLAAIVAESQAMKTLIWQGTGKPESWNAWEPRTDTLFAGVGIDYGTAMKGAKKLTPNNRIEHRDNLTDAIVSGMRKKFAAAVTAAGGNAPPSVTKGKGKAAKEDLDTRRVTEGPKPRKERKLDIPADPANKAEEIEELLEELRACTDGDEKKRIRRKLRSRGHFGGLGERATGPKPAKETPAPAPKGKAGKSKGPNTPDADEDTDLPLDEDEDD